MVKKAETSKSLSISKLPGCGTKESTAVGYMVDNQTEVQKKDSVVLVAKKGSASESLQLLDSVNSKTDRGEASVVSE